MWGSEGSLALTSHATEGSSRALLLSGRPDTLLAAPHTPAPPIQAAGVESAPRCLASQAAGGTAPLGGVETKAG